MNRIGQLDGLRALAIFLVLIQHIQHKYVNISPGYQMGVFEKINSTAAIGVELFFLISGAVIFLQLDGLVKFKYQDIKNFYLRRFKRIWFPYFISLIIGSLTIIYVVNEGIGSVAKHFIASCIFLHNIIYGYGSLNNPVAWSLEIEIQFYLIAPIIFIIINN